MKGLPRWTKCLSFEALSLELSRFHVDPDSQVALSYIISLQLHQSGTAPGVIRISESAPPRFTISSNDSCRTSNLRNAESKLARQNPCQELQKKILAYGSRSLLLRFRAFLGRFGDLGLPKRPLSSSFLGLPYRILNTKRKKELLRGLWVGVHGCFVSVASGLPWLGAEGVGLWVLQSTRPDP